MNIPMFDNLARVEKVMNDAILAAVRGLIESRFITESGLDSISDAEWNFCYGYEDFDSLIHQHEDKSLAPKWREARQKRLELERQRNPYEKFGRRIAERNYTPEELKRLREDWDITQKLNIIDAMSTEFACVAQLFYR